MRRMSIVKIEIFGTTTCAFCHTEKQWLDSKNVKYKYHNIDEDEDAKKYLQTKIGVTGVPVTFVTTKHSVDIIKGFDRPRLSSAIGI